MKKLLHLLILMLLCGAAIAQQDKRETKDTAPLAEVPKALSEADLANKAKVNTKAKVYFLYMSRSTCGICVQAAPMIMKVYKKMKGKKAELVMLNIDKDKETAAKWVKKENMKAPVVAPEAAERIPFPYQAESDQDMLLPHMVAVDAHGNKLGQANGAGVVEFLQGWKKIVADYEASEKKAPKGTAQPAED